MSLIEREALCQSIYKEVCALNPASSEELYKGEVRGGSLSDVFIQRGLNLALLHVRLQPEVEPERKHGKWIKLYVTWYGEHCMTTYACDQCGHDRQFIGPYTAAYCENCGTIMEGCDDDAGTN